MTTTAVTAPVPGRHGLANAFGRRQLYKYPDTWPRLGYLSIVVLTTIMLYYLYYVEGAVTPLLLPYYHMSFQFFLYLLVVSNAIGAFSAFIGGLSDKIGRANLTIYGTLVVALVQLFAIPHITDKWWFAAVLLRDRVRGGRHPRLDAGADARLLAADGSRRRHGVLGARSHHGRAVRPAWWRRTRLTTSRRGRTSSSSRAWSAWASSSSRSSSSASSRRSCATS